MSSSTDQLVGIESTAERRFYPRIEPAHPTYVAFGEDNPGVLLNIGENGLLVSTPKGLDLNSVFRVSLNLPGLPNPIEVHVRTVWTMSLLKRAGIQLLDLSEFDREQIRKWSALELDQQKIAELEFAARDAASTYAPPDQPVAPPPPPPPERPAPEFGRKSETAFGPSFEPPLQPIAPGDFGFPLQQDTNAPRFRQKRRSAAPAIVAWGVAVVVALVGAVMFLAPGVAQQAAHQLLNRVAHSQTQPADTSLPANAAPGSSGQPASADQPTFHDNSRAPKIPDTEAALESNRSAPAKLPRSRASVPATPSTSQRSSSAQDSSIAPATRSGAASDFSDSSSESSAAHSFSVKPSAPQIPQHPQEALETAPAPAAFPSSSAPAVPNNTQAIAATPAPFVPAPNTKTAITGSINNSKSSTSTVSTAPAPSTTSSATLVPMQPGTAQSPTTSTSSGSTNNWPSSKQTSGAGKFSFLRFFSRSDNSHMDAPSGEVTEIVPPRRLGSSYVNLPGEQVFTSPTLTMHVQRSVLVPGEHWVWRTHKPLALGQLVSHVDPQLPHLPVTTGSITVLATIDKDGNVSNLKPLNGSFAFLPSVARAVREWRYEPTYLDSKPVETQAQIEIDFHH